MKAKSRAHYVIAEDVESRSIDIKRSAHRAMASDASERGVCRPCSDVRQGRSSPQEWDTQTPA